MNMKIKDTQKLLAVSFAFVMVASLVSPAFAQARDTFDATGYAGVAAPDAFAGSVDQECTNGVPNFQDDIDLTGLSHANTFIPTVDEIVAVDIEILQLALVSAQPITIQIKEGSILGTIIGTTSVHTGLPGVGNTAFVHFDFADQVPLTPGATYVISPILNSAADSGDLAWPSGTDPNCLGDSITFGTVSGEDRHWRTYFNSPVGGEFLPIDNTALMLAGLQSSAIWMLPALAGIAGVGAYFIRSRMTKE